MTPYLPHTQADIRAMLDRCGLEDLDDLYADVPESLKLKRPYDLPAPKSEEEVREYFKSLADNCFPMTCFAGYGFYDHYAPAVVQSIISRSEFLTAYTPYQPEVSQGTLQYIFEYQSMMCSLTGLDVSNASMYDGSTALAEAMMMCVAASKKRNRVLVSGTLTPMYVNVMMTYAHYHGITLDLIPDRDGVTDLDILYGMLGEGDVAGVVLATPNVYGILEDFTGVAESVHKAKALLVITTPASALAVLKTPAEWGADIAAGEAQSLGMPLSYGGPGLGYMCCTKALMRKLPGRIVGATTDAEGRRVFVLTLQAREQHIRRDKATSNICSNQGLMALYAAVYLSLMGPEGMREVNRLSCDGAHELARRLCETGLFEMTYPDKPYLNEFLLTYRGQSPLDEFVVRCFDAEILPGAIVGDDKLLVAVTERRSAKDIDTYVNMATLFTQFESEED